MPSIVDTLGVATAPAPRLCSQDTARFRTEAIHRRNQNWLTVLRTLGKSKRETAKILGVPWITFRAAIDSAETRERQAAEAAPMAPEAIPGTGLTTDDLIYLQETYPRGTPIGDDPEVRRFFRTHAVSHLTHTEVAERKRARRLEHAEIAGEVA